MEGEAGLPTASLKQQENKEKTERYEFLNNFLRYAVHR